MMFTKAYWTEKVIYYTFHDDLWVYVLLKLGRIRIGWYAGQPDTMSIWRVRCSNQ
jgi:hypothetical protein